MDKKNSLAVNGSIFCINVNKQKIGKLIHAKNFGINSMFNNLKLNSVEQTIFR